MSITEFKKRMKVGSQWFFRANWCLSPVQRTCTISQTKNFALTSVRNPQENSYCDFPKKKEAIITMENNKITVKITHDCGWLEYKEV